MSRFFKSAAFPILIVVVLAFLAVKLVNPGPASHRTHNYGTLVAKEIPNGEVSSVEFKNKGKALEVKLKNKETWEAGYNSQSAPELVKAAARTTASPTTSNRKRAARCCRCSPTSSRSSCSSGSGSS